MSADEECFADEETGFSAGAGVKHNYPEQETLELSENDCVFDKSWAWERKCSMSSLLHSRRLWRLKWTSTRPVNNSQRHETHSQNALKEESAKEFRKRKRLASSPP